MKKIRPIKNIWYDQLNNYIAVSITRSADSFKDKIVSLFKTNAPKKTAYGRGKKLSKPKIKNTRKKKKKPSEKRKKYKLKIKYLEIFGHFLQQKKKKKKGIRQKKTQ